MQPSEKTAIVPRAPSEQPAEESSNEAHAGVQAQLRGLDFAQGASLLAPQVQRKPAAVVQRGGGDEKQIPKLLTDFAKDFADAAKDCQKSVEAMALINEAAKAGVEYGGFAETGPGQNAWAYTIGNKVYVPQARTDAILAMSDFLFELNNAVRKPAFDKIHDEAAKGSKSDVAAAKKYAYDKVTQEVEGMLRLGKVWDEAKKALGGGQTLDQYDAEFYRSEYEDYVAAKKTKEDIIKDVCQRKYTGGVNAGKTVEQYYMEQYKGLAQNA